MASRWKAAGLVFVSGKLRYLVEYDNLMGFETEFEGDLGKRRGKSDFLVTLSSPAGRIHDSWMNGRTAIRATTFNGRS